MGAGRLIQQLAGPPLPAGPAATDCERLDHYLVRCGFTPSRRNASALISSGRVSVNGRRCRKGRLIGTGDRVEVLPEGSGRPALESQRTLEILYEDAGLLMVAKPPLLACHPLNSAYEESVITTLARDYPEVMRIGQKPLEGGLIHRLDNGTSGALMVARTPTALAFMRDALRAGRIYRRYEALIEGRLELSAEFTWPIAHHRKNPARMVVADASPPMPGANPPQRIVRAPYRGAPREAFSRAEPVAKTGMYTLANVIPQTGRRHQIRVHLAAAGYPIANDQLYGAVRLPALPEGRFWLHLAEMRFTSPAGREVRIVAPRWPDLERAWPQAAEFN